MGDQFQKDKISQLLGRLRQGNKQERKAAFEKVVQMTQESLFKYSLYLTGNRQQALDICQETYLQMLLKIDQLKSPNKFAPWLHRIARNFWLDFLKSPKNNPRINIPETYLDEKPKETASSDPDTHIDIFKIIQSLSPEFREVIILVDLQGLSYGEAAEVIDISENAVRSRLHRARKEFSRRYE